MRRLLILAVASMAGAFQARAGTTPLYINEVDVRAPFEQVAPQIDATAFWNQAVFEVNNFGLSSLPYQLFNNRFITNDAAGYMIGDPGYRFDHFTRNVRKMMGSYVNLGTNIGTKWLLISATNIESSGRLGVGAAGLLRLNGRNVSLERNGIRAGNEPGTFLGDGFVFGSNYINAVGVSDLYWGVGTNNVLAGAGRRMLLDSSFPPPDFRVPNAQSATHQVVQPSFGRNFTNIVTLPQFNFFNFSNFFGFGGVAAFAYTNTVGPTSRVVQVVFVTTNSSDPTLTTQVRFYPNGNDNGSDAIVEFAFSDYDIVNETISSNYVYFIDRSAFVTNLTLGRPLVGRTRRPATYEVARSTPFEYFLGVPPNFAYTNTLIYNPTLLSNAVTIQYAGYAAQVSSIAVSNASGASVALSDPTNYPGRVEILSDKVNLDQARIRAESTIILRTKNLTSNHLAKVDAPYLVYDLTSVEPELVISNLAPVGVSRLSGQLAAWTGLWKNYETNAGGTTEIQFHVLFVDNRLQTFQPVVVNEFRAHATNLVIQDVLPVRKTLLLDAKALTVTGGLSLPFGNNWATTNVLKVVHFTNDGFINVPGAAKYGTDRALPYTNFVNRGTNNAGAQSIRARYFENSGCVAANRGVFNLDAVTANLVGAPIDISTSQFSFCVATNGTNVFLVNCSTPGASTNFVDFSVTNSAGAKLASSSALEIRAGTLMLSNALLISGASAPGTLRLSITNELVDGGPGSLSQWFTSGGFQMTRRPAFGDLRRTHVTSRVGAGVVAFHTWAGQDFGANSFGFENNLALGKLTFVTPDGGSNATFRFRSGTTGPSALYVDYLEFKNYPTNYNQAFAIQPDLTIYFANANVAVKKLDGAANGRIRWVRDYTGPLSSTNFTYPSSNMYVFNIALVTSKDIDSDGDGFSNYIDPTPFGEEPLNVAPISPASLRAPESVVLRVGMLHNPAKGYRRAVLSWDAPARAASFLEYKESLASANWLTLTNVVGGAVTAPASVFDDVPASASRFYRVRVHPVTR